MYLGLLIALIVFLLDQASKFFVSTYLLKEKAYIAITPYFNIIEAWNTGVSFSMFDGYGVVGAIALAAVALSIVGFLLHWLRGEKNLTVQVALGFVIGGALGNVLDRIRLGAVFDFLDFYHGTSHWPAFNIADSFICLGAAILIFQEIFIRGKGKKR